MHSLTAGNSEVNEARITNKHQNEGRNEGTNTVPSRDLLKLIYRYSTDIRQHVEITVHRTTSLETVMSLVMIHV